MKLLHESCRLKGDLPDWQNIPFDAPHQHIDILRRLYESGECDRCIVKTDTGEDAGSLYYQVEQGFLRELVILGVYIGRSEASPSNIPWLNEMTTRLGNEMECVSVRFHTLRPAMVTCALNHGWRVSEIVMRKEVRKNEVK